MSNGRGKNSVNEPAEPAGQHLHAADLRAAGHLLLLALGAGIDKIESLHLRALAGRSGSGHDDLAGAAAGAAAGAPWYRRARAVLLLAGRGLAPGADISSARLSSTERDAVLAALNGLFGDLLERLDNGLAIPMRLRLHGQPLVLETAALARAIASPGSKLLILVHGLCRSDLQWRRAGHDHGAALGRALGYTALYLHYNSGRHISVNGRELAGLLEVLVAQWPVPVESLAIIGHSMGGLVARSACYYGRQAHHGWLPLLQHMIFLGTPHHGAPLERHGNWLGAVLGRSALTAPFARLGEMRSAGITDLRYGNLLDEDWQGRGRFEHSGDLRRKLPLPRGVRCYTIAGTTGRRTGDLRDRLLGDGLIPLDTALGRHSDPARTLAFPKARQSIAFGVHHLDLLSRAEVYETMLAWLRDKRAG
ncbi:esterase/lipase family protein [Massilia sp. DWR3-1-1]|uniref:esterase/lipase family protein n=1 Tax=Massilia sp. DWR3-1-1 TaxID=2804559 RepID=UPI003CEEEBCE